MESASPDLKNLLLQNLIISPSILLLYSTVLLNKRNLAIFCLQLEKKNFAEARIDPGPFRSVALDPPI